MKSKFIYAISAAILLFSIAAFSQTGENSPAALPAAPGADPTPAPAGNPNATKVAAINIEGAIFLTNEGQRDMAALQKKFEPKRSELNTKREEIDALKKQQSATGVTDEKKADLQRQIDQKQKALERDAQAAQEDYQGQQSEVGQRIFQKVGPVLMKYLQENGFGMAIDTSTPWPNGPVLWANPASLDITKAVVDMYNAQSGVPAPTTPAVKPPLGSTRPSGSATKPPSSATKPPTTTAPPK